MYHKVQILHVATQYMRKAYLLQILGTPPTHTNTSMQENFSLSDTELS